MIVYVQGPVVPGGAGGLVPCALKAADGRGLAVEGEDWSLRGFTGPVYDEDGNELPQADLQAALLREEAQAVWDMLGEAHLLDGLLASADLLERLLDGLEMVPILREIIRRVREGVR